MQLHGGFTMHFGPTKMYSVTIFWIDCYDENVITIVKFRQ